MAAQVLHLALVHCLAQDPIALVHCLALQILILALIHYLAQIDLGSGASLSVSSGKMPGIKLPSSLDSNLNNSA